MGQAQGNPSMRMKELGSETRKQVALHSPSVDSVPTTPAIPRPCNVTGPLDVSPAFQVD